MVSPILGRTTGVECKQSRLGDQQIRQAEEGVKLRHILGNSLVAHLHAEEVLDGMEQVL
jgi:hypothetical protein